MLQFVVFLSICAVNGAPPSVINSTPHGTDHLATVSDRTSISNITISMVDKGTTKSGNDVMGLPDNLVFDALIDNVNNLQDQIELCEEELIEKIESTRLLRQGHQANDNADSEGGKTSRLLNGLEGESRTGDGDKEEERRDKSKKVGRGLKRRAARKGQQQDTLVHELVNRLSSRIDYLKSSLAHCYGINQVWNKKQS